MTKLNENNRVYTFPNQESVIVPQVRDLRISATGNHKLITEDGRLHLVPKGWLHIEINSDKGWEL